MFQGLAEGRTGTVTRGDVKAVWTDSAAHRATVTLPYARYQHKPARLHCTLWDVDNTRADRLLGSA